ncbi:MAG: SDR family NAD(P)-dependent oxidoreductase [Campylobacterales bacterium]|nr:SDR family NAD(P)-dependent oxidoreductase [Campylobacterales bacterium]
MGYILVTGSTKGIGLEIAKSLSYAGFSVIVTGRDEIALSEAKNILNNKVEHKFVKIDFQNSSEVDNFLSTLENIDAVIHNLGAKIEGDKHPINIDVLNKSINLNFSLSVKINNALVDASTSTISKIIYIGSTASLHAKASPCYVLSKSLIDTYVKNISGLYADKGILICGVQPGIIAHAGSDWDRKKESEPQKYNDVKAKQPLKRFLMPVDIAEYILLLMKLNSLALTGSMMKLDANDY